MDSTRMSLGPKVSAALICGYRVAAEPAVCHVKPVPGDSTKIFQALDPPKPTALRQFLEWFHDPALEALRPPREQQLSIIVRAQHRSALQGLQQVPAGGCSASQRSTSSRDRGSGEPPSDQDATIIESHELAAYAPRRGAARPDRGGRGYQPMVAVWAEADLIVADQFRDGNVPAHQEPLSCCQMAFAALPTTVTERYFVATVPARLCLSPLERTARFKKYRLLMVHVAGRMNRNNCVMGLRFCAAPQTIARMSAVWEVFWLTPPGHQRTPPGARRIARPSSCLLQLPQVSHPQHRHAPPAAALRPALPPNRLAWGQFPSLAASQPVNPPLHRVAPLPVLPSTLLRAPKEPVSRLRRGFGVRGPHT